MNSLDCGPDQQMVLIDYRWIEAHGSRFEWIPPIWFQSRRSFFLGWDRVGRGFAPALWESLKDPLRILRGSQPVSSLSQCEVFLAIAKGSSGKLHEVPTSLQESPRVSKKWSEFQELGKNPIEWPRVATRRKRMESFVAGFVFVEFLVVALCA